MTDKHNPWLVYALRPDEPDTEPLKVLLPDDGTRGIVIGEDWEIRHLVETLTAYLETGKTEGEISQHDYQLGYKWLSVDDALELATGLGKTVNGRTLRWACKNGFIRDAEKQGRDWRFPQVTFLYWLNNRPKPGRK